MANLDRDAFVAELKKRGWSRFLDADLQQYLNWALQDLYNKAKFPRSTLTVATVLGTVLDTIPFATITSGTDEALHQIKAVFVKYSGKLIRLLPADEPFFFDVVWPSTEADTSDEGNYPTHYFVYDLKLYLWPKPSNPVDIHIHYLIREDVFTGGSDTTGLPERFDKALIALAEVHCYRRAHEVEGMAVAQNTFDQFLLDELGSSGMEMGEKVMRIQPWRG